MVCEKAIQRFKDRIRELTIPTMGKVTPAVSFAPSPSRPLPTFLNPLDMLLSARLVSSLPVMMP